MTKHFKQSAVQQKLLVKYANYKPLADDGRNDGRNTANNY